MGRPLPFLTAVVEVLEPGPALDVGPLSPSVMVSEGTWGSSLWFPEFGKMDPTRLVVAVVGTALPLVVAATVAVLITTTGDVVSEPMELVNGKLIVVAKTVVAPPLVRLDRISEAEIPSPPVVAPPTALVGRTGSLLVRPFAEDAIDEKALETEERMSDGAGAEVGT